MTWNYAYTPDIWPSACTVLLLLALDIFSWRRQEVLVIGKGIAGKRLCGGCNRLRAAGLFDSVEICVAAIQSNKGLDCEGKVPKTGLSARNMQKQ
jgi:hypothetical protein